MKDLALWKDRKLLIRSFLGFILLGLQGFLLLPKLIWYMQLHVTGQTTAAIGFYVLFIGSSILILGWITFQACRYGRLGISRSLAGYYKRTLLFCIVAAVIYLLFSLLDGFVAMLLYHIFHNTLNFLQLKQAIDLAVSLISVLIMPVILMQFFTFALYHQRFFKTIRAGFKVLRKTYFKLLLVAVGLYLLGVLIQMAAAHIAPIWLQRLWLIGASSLLGTLAVIVVYTIAFGAFQRRGKSSC